MLKLYVTIILVLTDDVIIYSVMIWREIGHSSTKRT